MNGTDIYIYIYFFLTMTYFDFFPLKCNITGFFLTFYLIYIYVYVYISHIYVSFALKISVVPFIYLIYPTVYQKKWFDSYNINATTSNALAKFKIPLQFFLSLEYRTRSEITYDDFLCGYVACLLYMGFILSSRVCFFS